MLKRRIIPCLDIKNGRTVKGVQFIGLRDAGDPIELAKQYELDGADELVFLDISATEENRRTLVELVKDIAKNISIPFTVGGGVHNLYDAQRLLNAGADKVSINSAAILKPSLITEIANAYGRQCVVVAIDMKFDGNNWMVFRSGGKIATNLKVIDWAQKAVELGAGELLLTSMNNDGEQKGFAIEMIEKVASLVSVPVISSGGAGCETDFFDVFNLTKSTGALAASVFHFGTIKISNLKQFLIQHKIPIRKCK